MGSDDAVDEGGGIYAWVRNPMYSGWWMLFAGICLQRHNVWTLLTIPANWVILTVTKKLTEEKWLLDLYGQDYADYRKRVNRWRSFVLRSWCWWATT